MSKLAPKEIAKLYPVGAIAYYPKSKIAAVLRSAEKLHTIRQGKRKRGEITHLSQKSLNRLNFLVQTTTVEFKSMLTLTYLCPPVNGRKAKSDLKAVLQWLKRRCDNELSYVWFCEFSGRYAIHFHILVSCVPNNDDIRDFALFWAATTNQGQGRYCHIRQKREMDVLESIISFNSDVSHERQVWESIRHKDGAARYCAKYASKPYQKEVPKWFRDIGRFWGASRDVRDSREKAEIIEINEDELRENLKEQKKKPATWDVLPRFLWGIERPKV